MKINCRYQISDDNLKDVNCDREALPSLNTCQIHADRADLGLVIAELTTALAAKRA